MRSTRTRGVAALVALGALGAIAVGAAGLTAAPGACRPGPAADCARADLHGARLAGRNLSRATLRRADLTGAHLERANLRRADLTRANLTRAHLRGADLRGATLVRARMRGADLRKAKLGGLRARRGRVAIATAPCRRGKTCSSDLRYADLRNADLNFTLVLDAKFGRADLTGASLVGAFLENVELVHAKLDGADFRLADFTKVNLRNASLVGVDFSGATFNYDVDLRGANLHGANLSGVDLSEVDLDASDLAGANIDGAILPENVQKSVPRTKAAAAKAFTATMTSGATTVTCTMTTECAAAATFNSRWTLAVTTTWAGFAMCPDGPVRLVTADGGATYTGSCTYTAFQGLTIRILPARSLTVRVVDLAGEPATIDRISAQWREPPSFGLVEAEHLCLSVTRCALQYPEGGHVKLAITGSSPYQVPASASCQGGTAAGDVMIVSGAPWQLTCRLGADGNPLVLDADQEIVVMLS